MAVSKSLPVQRYREWSIATKVCVQNSRKWNVMFESHLETCIDWTSLDFQFIGFLSNLLLKIFIQFVTDAVTKFRPTIHNLIFKNCPKFQALTFLRLMSCSMSNEQNLCEKKYFNSNLYPKRRERYHLSIKGVLSRFLIYFVWPWYWTWTIWEWQSCTQKIGSRLRNMTSRIPFLSW